MLTDRVASRLVEAIERDELERAEAHDGRTPGRAPLAADARRQQLLVGAWLNDEIALVNQDRMRSGEAPLAAAIDRELRGRVLAELTGAGPLEPFMSDPLVEEIDVNSHLSAWVTYSDGRKIDVGQLWDSPAALTAYQKRLARRKAGTGEGRLDTQSPMLTFQADDGSRVVMVLGGRSEHGISTHPRIAIRRFVLRQEGLDGLARRGCSRPTSSRGYERWCSAASRSSSAGRPAPARPRCSPSCWVRSRPRARHHRREEPARVEARGRPPPP